MVIWMTVQVLLGVMMWAGELTRRVRGEGWR
jgi:hypothetical protein